MADPALIRNGVVIDRSWGIYECYRGSDDYYGWVFFTDGSREPHFWLDGRGSCAEGIVDQSLDIGSAQDDVKIWTKAPGELHSYKWNFLNDGTFVPFTNGTGQIGLADPELPFRNPVIYAEEIYIGNGSLIQRLADLESRIDALEAQLED